MEGSPGDWREGGREGEEREEKGRKGKGEGEREGGKKGKREIGRKEGREGKGISERSKGEKRAGKTRTRRRRYMWEGRIGGGEKRGSGEGRSEEKRCICKLTGYHK